ncbi:MAG TPA: GGDEF domain-containing protein [Tahibacter sp.]|nr:GGDEF domain-containing protein [Tahibacter sp.]
MPPPNTTRSHAEFERAAECATMARRGVVGGFYYVAGWIVVCVDTVAFARHPLAACAVGAAFLGLALVRVALARATPREPAQQGRHLDAWWRTVLATAALWSLVSAWCCLDADFGGGQVVALMCSMVFSTAIVFAYAMRRRRVLVGLTLLLAPSLVWAFVSLDRPGVAIVLAAYAVWLVVTLFANHADYRAQCAQRRELAEQRDRYAGLAQTDALTRLPNRRVFAWTLEQSFAGEGAASLLIVDIDHFKRVNDTHGHAAGDACLVAFAQLLRDAVAGADALVARLGGEEFGIVLAGIAQPAANRLALTIRRRLHEATDDPALRGVTASIGVGDRRADYRRPEEWFVEVDRALYRAKNGGRDRVCCVCASWA